MRLSDASLPLDLLAESKAGTGDVHKHAPATHVIEGNRYTDFQPQFLTINAVATLVLQRPPRGRRTILMIQNLHGVQSLAVGFDRDPIIGRDLQINAGGVLLLDTVVPQNDISLIGSGAGTTCVLVWANDA